jgi:hypothetical protein
MFTKTIHVPVTPGEIARQRADEQLAMEMDARDNLARENRKAGKPSPTPGDKLYVATARGIKQRARAGLQFSQQPAEVTVIDASDEAVAEKQKSGAYVVNPWGAEQILADSNGKATGLVLFQGKERADADVTKMSDTALEAAAAELARRKAAPAMKGEERIGSTKRDEARLEQQQSATRGDEAAKSGTPAAAIPPAAKQDDKPAKK